MVWVKIERLLFGLKANFPYSDYTEPVSSNHHTFTLDKVITAFICKKRYTSLYLRKFSKITGLKPLTVNRDG